MLSWIFRIDGLVFSVPLLSKIGYLFRSSRVFGCGNDKGFSLFTSFIYLLVSTIILSFMKHKSLVYNLGLWLNNCFWDLFKEVMPYLPFVPSSDII